MKRVIVLLVGLSVILCFGYALRAQREEETQQLQFRPRAEFQRRRPGPVSTPVAKPAMETSNRAGSTAEPVKADIDGKRPEMKVANSLDRNPELSSILKPLLPARTTVTDAATGFKKQGHFIAALHASKNLGIPFHQIKTKMTGDERRSLKEAVQDLRPAMEKDAIKEEVKKAEKQAKADEKQAKADAKAAKAAAEMARRTESGN